MNRRLVAVAAGTLLALGLAGCTGGPTEADRSAWSGWFTEVSSAGSGNSVGGQVTDSSAASATRIDFAEPATFTSVELRCIGSDRAAFTLTYTGADTTLTLSQDIVCHGGEPLTPIAVPAQVGALTAFAAAATSAQAEGYWVATLQP
ncbi:hypothetical protein [uncultured Microbacterium sp.]|uniref:hypothetical protein n=1 Tax=uncultured Microbacterium sp. TaxID=191216 RepID=UPI00262FA7A5|nr:hypothetical protein [uncultured Microbacterium sp.]